MEYLYKKTSDGAAEEKKPPLVIKNAKFVTSAATSAQFIKADKPMIAVCGKSNVGKSTFINMLAGQKRLAKTSAAPGRTRLVNYFDFGEFYLVDLPGYGYAEVSRAEKAKWAKTLDKFFENKRELAHVFLLLDCRHDPTAEDLQMLSYLNYHVVPFTAVLTKGETERADREDCGESGACGGQRYRHRRGGRYGQNRNSAKDGGNSRDCPRETKRVGRNRRGYGSRKRIDKPSGNIV